MRRKLVQCTAAVSQCQAFYVYLCSVWFHVTIMETMVIGRQQSMDLTIFSLYLLDHCHQESIRTAQSPADNICKVATPRLVSAS